MQGLSIRLLELRTLRVDGWFKSCEEEKGVLSCTLTRVITDDYSCPSSVVKRKSFQQNQKTTVTDSSGLKGVLNRFVVFPCIFRIQDIFYLVNCLGKE